MSFDLLTIGKLSRKISERKRREPPFGCPVGTRLRITDTWTGEDVRFGVVAKTYRGQRHTSGHKVIKILFDGANTASVVGVACCHFQVVGNKN